MPQSSAALVNVLVREKTINWAAPPGAINVTRRSPIQVCTPVKLTRTSVSGPVIPVTLKLTFSGATVLEPQIPLKVPESGIPPTPVPGNTAAGAATAAFSLDCAIAVLESEFVTIRTKIIAANASTDAQ